MVCLLGNNSSFSPGRESFCADCIKKDRHKKCTASGVITPVVINGKKVCGRKEISVSKILPPQQEGL